MSYEERRRARQASREARQQFNEARSLWASELYRLSIANQASFSLLNLPFY